MPKNESQTKEVKFHFAILLVVYCLEGLSNSESGRQLRKDRLAVRGKPGTDTSQYCDYQNICSSRNCISESIFRVSVSTSNLGRDGADLHERAQERVKGDIVKNQLGLI